MSPPSPLLHCYRCIYSWRPRRGPPRICPRCKSKLWNAPKIRPRLSSPTGLAVPQVVWPHLKEIRRLTRRYQIQSLRVFGSVARGEATPSSDVDLMFESRKPMGLLQKLRFQEELERILRRRVDLVREEYLKWYLRPQALADAVAL